MSELILTLEAGTMRVFARKEVVDEVFDPRLEISIRRCTGKLILIIKLKILLKWK